jgi:hypothetical protein
MRAASENIENSFAQRISGIALFLALPLAVVALATTGCGDYSGGEGVEPSPFAATSAPSGISEAEQIESFETTLWPLLKTQTCGDCHTSSGTRGTPFLLADSNSTVAYRAIVDNSKVNFDSPSESRLVARLAADQHHCWNDCSTDGNEMLIAIEDWLAEMEARGGSVSGGVAVTSGTLVSNEADAGSGVEDEGGLRYTVNQIGFWKFDEYDAFTPATTAFDTSGVNPAINFDVTGGPQFMQAYGLEFANQEVAASSTASRKIYDHIANPSIGTGQYSVEMWFTPANTNQDSEILQLSSDLRIRQREYQYDIRVRSYSSGHGPDGGTSRLLTYDQDRDLNAGLQHAVITYDVFNGSQVYVNGVNTDDQDSDPGGPLWNWSTNSRLQLGDDDNGGWYGQIRMLAIHKEALNADQIQQNFSAGVGLRLTVTFDISQFAGAGSVMEVSLSQLDDKSYLLCQPTVITDNLGMRISGLRINVRGGTNPMPAAFPNGQAFSRLNTRVRSNRHQISDLCTIVANPPGTDTFQLYFEGLSGWVDPVSQPSWPPIQYDYTGVQASPYNGIRDFAKVNFTMAEITGVLASNANIDTVYQEVRQQLPGGPDMRSFVSSGQVGIAKLAYEYCNELVEDAVERDVFFDQTPFDWADVPSVAFDTSVEDKRLRIVEPLVRKTVGAGLTTQPGLASTEGHLLDLADNLVADCGLCDAAATRSVVKGICAAALANGATQFH